MAHGGGRPPSADDPHISLTNKAVSVGALETRFTQPQIKQLVQNRILVVEQQPGHRIRIVKGITTSTNTAFHQITTRRIVDYAKYRRASAASPYIGLLNNERVRGALKSPSTASSRRWSTTRCWSAFEVDVFATRQDEIKGIATSPILLPAHVQHRLHQGHDVPV